VRSSHIDHAPSALSIASCNDLGKSSRFAGILLAGLDTAAGQVPAPARPRSPLATIRLLPHDFRASFIMNIMGQSLAPEVLTSGL